MSLNPHPACQVFLTDAGASCKGTGGARTTMRALPLFPESSLPRPDYPAFYAPALTSITSVVALRSFISCLPNALLLPTTAAGR